MRLVLAIVALLSSTAAAAPECVNAQESHELRAAAARLLVCERNAPACFDVESERAVKRPTPLFTWRSASRKAVVCHGERCRRTGKQLAARLAKLTRQRATYARENPDHPIDVAFGLELTSDLGRAVITADISETELWDVVRDRRIVPREPQEYATAAAPPNPQFAPQLGWISLAGDTVVARWSTCFGTCARSVIVAADGTNLPGLLPGGRALGLGGNRVALVPSDQPGTITVVDATTATILNTIPFDPDHVLEVDAVALGADEIGLSWRVGTQLRAARVRVPAGAPPVAGAPRPVKLCAPPT